MTTPCNAPCADSHLSAAPAFLEERSGFSLRSNFLWVIAGNAIHLTSQWFLVFLIARLGTPVMVGQLALAFAWTAPLFLLSHLRLRAVQATDASGEFRTSDYLMLRIVTTGVALGITILFAILYAGNDRTSLLVIAGVGLAKSFESGSDILYGFFQRCEEIRLTAYSMIARSAFSILIVGAVMYRTRDIVASALALAASSLALLLLYDIPAALHLSRGRTFDSLRPRWRANAIKGLARTAFPLGVSAMLMSLSASVPRYFVEHYSGTREVGIFAAVSYLALASGYAVSAMGEAISASLSRSFAAGLDQDVHSLLTRCSLIAVAVGVACSTFFAIFGRTTLATIYGSEYAEALALLIWLSLAAVMGNAASILGYGMIAVRKFREQVTSLVIMLAATTVFCALLIPLWGSVGAALSLGFAYASQAAYTVYAMRHETRLAWQRTRSSGAA